METIFKKIHEGLDLFNYYFTRHEASSNESQREKLESDLKKEIKKLQKFRDQIKTWQGNDALETTIAPQKLQEHRRLVEEAMECYKEVEKNLKMKSFSNQSIMLAAKDNGDHLITPEMEEALEFLAGVEDELNEQNEALEEEYDKLSAKKVRKNNQQQIEERKQELEGFKLKNEFHLEQIDAVVRYLKTGKIAVESVWAIQDDLNFYVESNQEPDFVDDDTLYDEILREAKENSENNTVVTNGHADESFDLSMNGHSDDDKKASVSPAPELHQLPTEPRPQSTPKKLVRAESGTTPGFVTTLKPATAPPKPVGALKWSLAAAGGAASPEPANGEKEPKEREPKEKEKEKQSRDARRESRALKEKESREKEPRESKEAKESKDSRESKDSKEPKEPKESKEPKEAKDSSATAKDKSASTATDGRHDAESNASSELLSLLTKNDEYLPYIEVLKNSGLLPAELDLFADLNLVRTPPGIQQFAINYTATNRGSHARLLVLPSPYVASAQFLHKPYLPAEYQPETLQPARLPMFLTRLQHYWNRVRASNHFNQVVAEVEQLEQLPVAESAAMVSELTLVLFYGYYCGYLPLENVVADGLLHKLGWAPYGAESGEAPRFWFRPLGDADSGEFRVFDLALWEIYVKHGFKFDPRLSQPTPARTLVDSRS